VSCLVGLPVGCLVGLQVGFFIGREDLIVGIIDDKTFDDGEDVGAVVDPITE